VREDLRLWAPKICAGGVIGGHDYLDGDRPSGKYGVKRAVDEFAGEYGFKVVVTREPDWPSWYIRVG
jgi:hypothetical protein